MKLYASEDDAYQISTGREIVEAYPEIYNPWIIRNIKQKLEARAKPRPDIAGGRSIEDIFAIADMYSMKIDDLLTLNKLESEYEQLEPGTILKVMTTSSRRNKSQQGNIASTGNKQDYDDEKYINSGEDGDDKYNSSQWQRQPSCAREKKEERLLQPGISIQQ